MALLRNSQINLAIQGIEISKFFVKVAETFPSLLTNRIHELFDCFYIQQNKKFDTKLVEVYKDYVSD